MSNTSDQSTPNEFSKFGRTQQAVFGGSDLYDTIDTTVYITGLGSTATAQFPLRILGNMLDHNGEYNACTKL